MHRRILVACPRSVSKCKLQLSAMPIGQSFEHWIVYVNLYNIPVRDWSEYQCPICCIISSLSWGWSSIITEEILYGIILVSHGKGLGMWYIKQVLPTPTELHRSQSKKNLFGTCLTVNHQVPKKAFWKLPRPIKTRVLFFQGASFVPVVEAWPAPVLALPDSRVSRSNQYPIGLYAGKAYLVITSQILAPRCGVPDTDWL